MGNRRDRSRRHAAHGLTPVLTALMVAFGPPALARDLVVGDTRGLLFDLAHASIGDVIRLKPGVYEGVNIRDFVGLAVITSNDPNRRATLSDLKVQNASGLRFRDLDFSTAGHPVVAGNIGQFIFQVVDSKNIEFSHIAVHGAPDGTLATDLSGLFVVRSDHVTVTDSDFYHLHHAFQHGLDTNLVVANSHFHWLRDDGIRGGGSSNVLIENNLCDSNHPDMDDPDHPDCIQFWTTNTDTPAHDITIRGNRYRRGTGRPVQGIFVRDDRTFLPFQNLVITGNDIEGALWNGICVMSTTKPVLENNRVCGYPDQESWLVIRDTTGAIVRHNHAQKIKYPNATAFRDEHNVITGSCKIDKG